MLQRGSRAAAVLAALSAALSPAGGRESAQQLDWPAECAPGGPPGGSRRVVDCEMVEGDGTGGRENRVGEAPTAAACAQMVRDAEPSANGATYSNDGGTECYGASLRRFI